MITWIYIKKQKAKTSAKKAPKDLNELATKNDVISIVQKESRRLEKKMDGKFENIDERFEKIDEKFEKVDKRFDECETKLIREFALMNHENLKAIKTFLTEELEKQLDKLNIKLEKTTDMVVTNRDELILAGHQIDRNNKNIEENSKKIKNLTSSMNKLQKKGESHVVNT